MHQQINFYQAEFSGEQHLFSAATLLIAFGAITLVMLLTFLFASEKLSALENEVQIVSNQETAAVNRLQSLGPVIAAAGTDKLWADQLDDAVRSLEAKQLVLTLVRGKTLGDTQGFSRHLRSLAQQDIDGLWLTHIGLSQPGDKTRIEGKALRAELVPIYLQNLADERPFATQRFQQFQIQGDNELTSGIVTFSMNNDADQNARVVVSR